MTGLVHQIVAFVAAHTTLAYGIVFLIALVEALPVIGTILPGSVVLVALAALIPSGTLGLWPMLIGALLGAIVGDGLSYWLGHHYRDRLLRIWPFSRSATLREGGAAAFAAHGVKAIFIGRFTPARSVVPVAAGIAGMPAGRFYAANVASALAWAPAHILPGALLGATITLLGAVAGRLAALFVVVVVVCWFVIWLTRFLARRLAPRLASTQAWLWQRAQGHPGIHAVIARLLDPHQPQAWMTLPLLIPIVLGLWLGGAVVGDASGRSGFDVGLSNLGATLRTEWADAVFGDAALVLGLGTCVTLLVVAAWSTARRAWRTLACWVVAVGIVMLVAGLTGHGNSLLGPLGQQSGAIAVILGLLTVICAREAGPRMGAALTTIGVTTVAVSFLVNVYFGLDPLHDLLTGLAVGLVAFGILGLALIAGRGERLSAVPLLLTVLFLAASGGVAVAVANVEYVGPARHQPVARPVAYDTWWGGAWSDLSGRRVDLGDEGEQPLTMQWAAPISDLATHLALEGWAAPAPWSWRSALAWLDAKAAPASLPVLPVLHAGRPPAVTLARTEPACPKRPCRLVLRLWPTDVTVTATDGSATPLLVGSVVREEFTRIVPLLTLALADADMNGPRDEVARALAAGKRARRQDVAPTMDWDGSVLLAPGPHQSPSRS